MSTPQRSYKEIRIDLKQCKNSNCPGGRIDLVSGQVTNGGRPIVEIKYKGNFCTVYLYAFNEMEIPEVHQYSLRAEHGELKATLQPITEILAFSEFVHNCTAPIVLFYGSRNAFRPFIYFKNEDVLLTIQTSVTFHDGRY